MEQHAKWLAMELLMYVNVHLALQEQIAKLVSISLNKYNLKISILNLAGNLAAQTACANNACLNGGTCAVNTYGLQYCTCPNGYTGAFCQYTNNCLNSPCKNSAICIDKSSTGGTYTCNCTANYYGPNCNYQITSQQISAGDTNTTACALWKANNFCNFNYAYNSVPVPVYCVSSCNVGQVLNSTCTGKILIK